MRLSTLDFLILILQLPKVIVIDGLNNILPILSTPKQSWRRGEKMLALLLILGQGGKRKKMRRRDGGSARDDGGTDSGGAAGSRNRERDIRNYRILPIESCHLSSR